MDHIQRNHPPIINAPPIGVTGPNMAADPPQTFTRMRPKMLNEKHGRPQRDPAQPIGIFVRGCTQKWRSPWPSGNGLLFAKLQEIPEPKLTLKHGHQMPRDTIPHTKNIPAVNL